MPATRALSTLVEAMTVVSQHLTALTNLRNEVSFHNLWEQSVFVADAILDIKLKTPRTLSRSVYRPNAEAEDDTAESYYRVSFFYSKLEKVVEDVQLRFGPQQQRALNISHVIPSMLILSENSSGEKQRRALMPAVQM